MKDASSLDVSYWVEGFRNKGFGCLWFRPKVGFEEGSVRILQAEG